MNIYLLLYYSNLFMNLKSLFLKFYIKVLVYFLTDETHTYSAQNFP